MRLEPIEVFNIETYEKGYANPSNIPNGWSAENSARVIVENYIDQKQQFEKKIQDKLREMAIKAEIILAETASVSTPAAGFVSVYADTTANPKMLFKDDGGTVVDILDSRNTVTGITSKTFTNPTLTAGSITVPSMTITNGSLLTNATVNTLEADGANFFLTHNVTTTGRGHIPTIRIFRLTANGGAIGNAIGDFFGATSSLSLEATTSYLFEAECWFLKSTAGTVVWTLTTSAANYINLAGRWHASPVATLATAGAMTSAGVVTQVGPATAFPATGSLTSAVNHCHSIVALIETNAVGNIRLRCTESAGTVTPLRGSYYKVTKLPANTGAFAA